MCSSKPPFVKIASDIFPLDGPVLRFETDSSDGESRSVRVLPLEATAVVAPGCLPPTAKTRQRLSDAGAMNLRLDRFSCLPFPSGAARTIVCEGTLPFVASPDTAIAELYRTLASDGYLLMQLEAEPKKDGDFMLWRPSPPGMARLLASFDAMLIAWEGASYRPPTLWAIACKGDTQRTFLRDAKRFIERMQTPVLDSDANGPVFPRDTMWRRLWKWVCGLARCRRTQAATAPPAVARPEMHFLVQARSRDVVWLPEI